MLGSILKPPCYRNGGKDGNTSPPTNVSKALQESGKQAIELAKQYVPDERQLGQMGGAAAEMFIFTSAKSGWEKINNTYAEPCKSILEKPEDRFQYWLNKSSNQLPNRGPVTVAAKSAAPHIP